MTLTSKVEEKQGYILVTFSGSLDSPSVNDFIHQTLEACEKYQPTKVLGDIREVKGAMSLMDRFYLGSMFAMKYFAAILTGRIKPCRYALVGYEPLIHPERFGETVAVNRGINAKAFTNMKNAMAWLEVEDKEQTLS